MNIHRSMVMVVILALGLLSAAAGNAIFSKAPLSDVSPLADPTDGGWAVASATVGNGRTVVVLNVKGLDPNEAGRTLGAHVHIGPCVVGDGRCRRRPLQGAWCSRFARDGGVVGFHRH